MTSRIDLEALAARVEAAEAADQCALLIEAFEGINGPRCRNTVHGTLKFADGWFAFKKMLDAEAYESAALQLVPEGWTRLTDNTDGREIVELYCPDYDKHGWVPQPIERGSHPTSLALAMCAAALLARARGAS